MTNLNLLLEYEDGSFNSWKFNNKMNIVVHAFDLSTWWEELPVFYTTLHMAYDYLNWCGNV